MTLNEIDKRGIKDLFNSLAESIETADKDFIRFVMRKIDCMPRELKIKMMADLCEYWSKENNE